MRRKTLKPDDERESWGFLSIDFSDESENNEISKIEGWCICYGNREKTTGMKSSQNGNGDEILAELDEEIKYSRDNGVLLVVFSRSTLKKLRTNFLFQDECLGVGMKETDFLCLEDLLLDKFEGFETSDFEDVCYRLDISVEKNELDMLNPLHQKGDNQEIVVQSLRLRLLFLKVGKVINNNTYN